ncbi:MAG: hypothetical protein K0U98_09185 [Deltaproteobacteria bacterium]|nr:hypothetical protein [Deltaproteobacteria bacterium]
MRTTIEINDEHRARLLELAARRGEKEFSNPVAEALTVVLSAQTEQEEKRTAALSVQGSLKGEEISELRASALAVRDHGCDRLGHSSRSL